MGTEIFNYFKTNFYSIVNCLHCQQAHGILTTSRGKKKEEKSGKKSTSIFENRFKLVSKYLSYFDYTEQLNVCDTTCITHIVVFVIKKFKIRTHFCSSTKKLQNIQQILKSWWMFHSAIFLITRKVPRSKLVIQCLCQTSGKENHILILCSNRKWKNCLYLCTLTSTL